MPDTTTLSAAVERLADLLRALPQSALQRGAAAEGLALARELAVRAQRLESPGREPWELPDAGLFAVGDQLAVAGNDLVEALALAGDEAAVEEAVRLVEERADAVTGAGRAGSRFGERPGKRTGKRTGERPRDRPGSE